MSGSTQVRAQLQHLVMKYGRNLAKEPKRIRAMLLDTCGVHKREVRLLTLMVEEGLTQILLRDLGSVSAAIVLPRMVDQLHTEFAIDRELAEWTVSTWSEVLGWGPAASEAIGTVETPPSPHQTLQSGFKSVSTPASGVPETLQKPELIFRDKLRDGSEDPKTMNREEQQSQLKELIAKGKVNREEKQSQLKELIAKGKVQGYLTYRKVKNHLPDSIIDFEQIEDDLLRHCRRRDRRRHR